MRASVLNALSWILLGSLVMAPVVSANAPSNDVAQLVEDGLKLRTEGRDAEALARFEAAYAVQREPRVLAQIALAEQALGRWAPAHVHISEALSHRDDPWIKQWLAELESTLQRIEAELGSLEVVSSVPGAAVFAGDHESGVAPIALRAVPGTFSVRVQAPGYQPFTQTVEVQKGKLTRVSATLVRAEQAAASIQAEPANHDLSADRPIWRRTSFLLTAAGAAATTFVIAATTYGIAGGKARSLKRDCYDKFCGSDEREDRREAVARLDRVSRTFFALGLITAVGAGVAYLVSSPNTRELKSTGLNLGAAVDRSGALLHATVAF